MAMRGSRRGGRREAQHPNAWNHERCNMRNGNTRKGRRRGGQEKRGDTATENPCHTANRRSRKRREHQQDKCQESTPGTYCQTTGNHRHRKNPARE